MIVKPLGVEIKENSVRFLILLHKKKTLYKHVHLEYFYTTVSFTSMDGTYEAMGK